MNITVVYSEPTRRAIASPYIDADEDTVESAGEVVRALREKGAGVTLVGVREDHLERLASLRADLIFNLIEWTGQDLPLADHAFAELETLGIPVTGATRTNYMETTDKAAMKQALTSRGLPTARFQIFVRGDEKVRPDFRYPVIVKPALEHCSIGLTHDAVVASGDMLRARLAQRIQTFEEPMIAEEFITGREFQVTVLETKTGLLVLPPAEILFTTKNRENLLTYDSRWDDETADYKSSHVALAVLDTVLSRALSDATTQTFRALGFRDYSRLDIRTRKNEIFILEANSNPGLSDDSEYGMTLSYRALGWNFSDFVWKIVESAMRRATKSNPPE